jgi:glucose/mannose-6-phosphate isomerase
MATRAGARHPLDVPSRRRRLDPERMDERIVAFPQHLRAGAAIAAGALGRIVPEPPPQRLILLGMGGSAIAGELLKSLVERERPTQIHVSRHYEPPRWIHRDDFLVFSSYSGETEETLAAYESLRGRWSRACALACGGTLAHKAAGDGLPVAVLPPGLPPRAALGYSFSALFSIAGRLGLLSDAPERLERAAARLERLASAWGPDVVVSRNLPKQLAIRLRGRTVLLLANDRTLQAAALRWKGQLNENAKHMAWVSPVPEMSHNEVDSFVNPVGAARRLAAVFLRDPSDHPRIVRRMDWLRSYLKRHWVRVEVVAGEGDDPLERLLGVVHLGDFVSYYLALLNRCDPSALPGVEALKRSLRT